MLIDALAGLTLGAAFAGLLGLLAWSGIERLNQGLISSLGFAALAILCLWTGAWLLTAIPGFAAAVAFGVAARAGLR